MDDKVGSALRMLEIGEEHAEKLLLRPNYFLLFLPFTLLLFHISSSSELGCVWKGVWSKSFAKPSSGLAVLNYPTMKLFSGCVRIIVIMKSCFGFLELGL